MITLYNSISFIVRNIAWIILLALCILLMLWMDYTNRKQDMQSIYDRAVYNSLKNEMDGVTNILSKTKNELGQEKTKVSVLLVNEKSLANMLSDQNNTFAKTLRDLKIDMKALQSVTNLKVTSSGQFVTVTRDTIVERIEKKLIGKQIVTDTIQEKLTLISYKEPNGWFDMSGSIHGDTMKFEPVFYEEFDVAIYEEKINKRYWLDFFPPKHTVATVQSKNPYARTNDVKIIVKEKERKGLFRNLYGR